MNSVKERIEGKCPSCGHWGKGHVIDIVTNVPVCTAKMVEDAKLADIAESMQKTDEGRVASWRLCSVSYSPVAKPSLVKRLFGGKKYKRYCPMCAKRVKDDELGGFCSVGCVVKFMEKEKKHGNTKDK